LTTSGTVSDIKKALPRETGTSNVNEYAILTYKGLYFGTIDPNSLAFD
jgi:hypothetical protein